MLSIFGRFNERGGGGGGGGGVLSIFGRFNERGGGTGGRRGGVGGVATPPFLLLHNTQNAA